jgi:hypothetical protein
MFVTYAISLPMGTVKKAVLSKCLQFFVVVCGFRGASDSKAICAYLQFVILVQGSG